MDIWIHWVPTYLEHVFGQTLTKVREVKFSFIQGHLGRASLEHRPALLDLCGQQHRAHQGEPHLGDGGHDCGGDHDWLMVVVVVVII